MICPYCGVSTDVAHESQEGCIKALNAEVARMREVLNHVRSVKVPGPLNVEREEEPDPTVRDPTKV